MVAKIARIGKRSRFRTGRAVRPIAMTRTLAYSAHSAAEPCLTLHDNDPDRLRGPRRDAPRRRGVPARPPVRELGRGEAGRGRGADRRADAGDGAGPLAGARARAGGDQAQPGARRPRRHDRPRRGGGADARRRRARWAASTPPSSPSARAAGRSPRPPASSPSPRRAIVGPPDGSQPRSISVEYDYGPAGAASPSAIRAGLAVPLANQGEQLGYLSAYSRTGRDAFGQAGAAELEELALRAGPAIDNAQRFREARQLADLDALTGLHNRRYFHETLAREVARAQRYNRSLALVVFDLDDFKAINDRIGHLAGDSVLAEAAERVRDVVRSADVACRVGGDEFAVILPESSLAGRRPALQAAGAGAVGPAGRPGGTVAPLGRRHGAAPGRRRDLVLRAGRRGALPREGLGQGNGRRDRDAYARAARGARNGIQLVSGTVPIVGRRSRTQRISSSARSWRCSAQAA